MLFSLLSAHYLLLSSPSKLVRVLGHYLKFSGTKLSVSKLMAVSAVLERPLAKAAQRTLWALIPRRAFDQMWWMNSSLLILQVAYFSIYNVLSTRRDKRFLCSVLMMRFRFVTPIHSGELCSREPSGPGAIHLPSKLMFY